MLAPAELPASESTVSVRVFRTHDKLVLPTDEYFLPNKDVPPIVARAAAPGVGFLIEHIPSGKKLVFDLGLRKDLDAYSPMALAGMSLDTDILVTKDTATRLKEGRLALESVNAVIWR
jgi:hypothetical protein